MLVKFISSETGELLMFADVARQLLGALGKRCLAQGSFTADEMAAAAQTLRRAVERGGAAAHSDSDEDGEAPVSLGNRAWPFIDMLERTAKGGARANIVWEAPGDFSA